ncbi:nuclear pore membrane glycoprotein 210 [Neodiprion virginianus]|uniref:nuclear pore membrane glycoprotein 210 n=1 Tax=Neodiprion virginianus TaxID=2961670 RepID=UPI001EE72A14|nr:nuclear pore membrane glycoprotein 210 [Neodiprion virginianus]
MIMAKLYNLYDKYLLVILCAVITLLSICVNTQRLNVPRVLLPIFNDFPTNFTLEVTEGGCYKWSSSRTDLIRLVPLNENFDKTCSSAVLVQTVTKDSTRNTAIVLAEDVTTGQFLRCDVIVDAIFAFNLVTTTRELFIEEAPEVFEVRANDEQGNEFTTLAGVEFMWTIGNVDKHRSQIDSKPLNNVLRFMTFQESPYETPPTVVELDSVGRKGHMTLLEGIRTGSAKVSVKLSHPEYTHVPPIEVELIVVANLIIIPSDVTMMAYDSFNYRIMQMHQGRLEEINLPSSQYYLEAENPDILKINNDCGSAYAIGRGKTKVLLYDRNVDEEYGIVLPSATVNINEPAYITLTVLPHRNWGLILGHTHEIVAEIYDNKDRKYHIGEGVEVNVQIDEKYLNVGSRTQNGTHVVATPIAMGTTIVEASLIAIISSQGKRMNLMPRLTTRAELSIHSQVIVVPKALAVPWDPRSKVRSETTLKASGGDGAYIWASQHPNVASVSQNGIVGVLRKGSAKIIVSMARNPHNRDETRIHVLTPVRLEIIDYNMEAAVGESIHIHVAMYGEMKKEGTDEVYEIPFNDCRDIPLDVYIPDGNFVYNNSETVESIGIACTTLRVVGLDVGMSSVTVAYNNNGGQYLMDNVNISAYKPLTALHPSTGDALLAVGSSRRLVFKGGPLPWFDKNQGYTREIKISNLGVLRWKEEEYIFDVSSDVYVYKIMCEALGDVTVTLTISNIPVLSNCRQTEASASVLVTCGKPRNIYLVPEFKDSEKCPKSQSTDHIMARSGEDFELTVIVKDEDGRTFDNATSLNVEWALNPVEYGSVEKVSGIMEETYWDMNVILPNRHYQRILPKQHTGMLQIHARVTGYQKRALGKLGIVPERPPFPTLTERGSVETPVIKKSINVTLVNHTVITPNNLKVLLDPIGKYHMQVSQGSGFYDLNLSSKDIANVDYVAPTKTITIVPRNSGILHIALVDLCLPSKPAEAVIEVQQLGGIKVEVIDKVEIDKCIVATLTLYDTNGRTMELPSIEAISIGAEIDNGRIEVIRLPNSDQGNPPYHEILYKVRGIKEGESQLSFESGKDEEKVHSEPITIQVFLPLKIIPKNVTILVGTLYQLSTIGGPSNAEIEFVSNDDSTLGVSEDGVLDGKLFGTGVISASAVGLTPNGKRVVYSKDSIGVQVVPLEGVKITAPTTRIKIGATIPVWAFGIPDQLTPLVIGSMKTPMRFLWSTSGQPGIIKLKNMYEGTGINIGYENEACVRVEGLQPGIATIHLNVTTSCETFAKCDKDTTFVAFLKIEIFQELHLVGVEDGYGRPVILMTPNSAFQLQTNHDKYSLSYKILPPGSSGETEDSKALILTNKNVTIDKNGMITSGETFGKTILSITSTEAYGLKQTLMVVVEVKPIHYMMLELKSIMRVRSGEELYSLPRGMTLDYTVGYYDNVGSKFNAGQTKLSIWTNRANLASFSMGSENTVSVQFTRSGHMVTKVYNEKQPTGMFDYVNMVIGDIVFPSKMTLTVGDIICFSMPLLSNDGDPGYWQSSNPELLTIDSLSGIGRALSPGRIHVKHSLAALIRDEIQLDIQPISKIKFVLPMGTNMTGTEVLGVPLILESANDCNKQQNILARGKGGCRLHHNYAPNAFPFTCTVQFTGTIPSIDIKDIFLSKPRFNIVTGFYYCDVISLGSPSKTTSTLDISLKIGAQSREIVATPVVVPYLPAIYVPVTEIIFAVTPTSSTPSAIIQVHGIPTVLNQLVTHLPDGLALVTGPQGAYGNGIQLKIRLTHNHDELQGSQVRVISEITKQDIHILVRVSQYDQAAPVSGIHWLDYAYYHRYTFGTFAALVITFFYIYGSKMMSINISVKNKSIFAEKCPPPIKKTYTPTSPSGNKVTSTPSPGSANTSLRPFSAFEPVYGDPRGFYTPNARRNRSLLSP